MSFACEEKEPRVPYPSRISFFAQPFTVICTHLSSLHSVLTHHLPGLRFQFCISSPTTFWGNARGMFSYKLQILSRARILLPRRGKAGKCPRLGDGVGLGTCLLPSKVNVRFRSKLFGRHAQRAQLLLPDRVSIRDKKLLDFKVALPFNKLS